VVAPTDGQSTVALQSTPQVQSQLRPEVVRATDFVPAEVKPVVTLAPEPVSVTALPAPVVSASSMPRPEAPESQASSSSIEHRHLPPLSSLRKVPDLIITGHIYSQDSSARTVSMNGREWYEGDLIVPGVFLQTITPTGIVLDVDGYPFSINRNSGWQSIGE
jgi:general secretion pathway protein B